MNPIEKRKRKQIVNRNHMVAIVVKCSQKMKNTGYRDQRVGRDKNSSEELSL
jgi:hypothetical protein